MRVDLHPEARTEFRSAALWYEERRDRLGEEFVVAVDAAFQRISKAPKLFPRWLEKLRAIRRFRPVSGSSFPSWEVSFRATSRGQRHKASRNGYSVSPQVSHPSCQPEATETADAELEEFRKVCRRNWARLIKKVYEVDPLV